jgi:hypothetical protein
MKNINFESINKLNRSFIYLIIIFVSLILSKEVAAQNVSIYELTRHRYALENLKTALSSDNCGIKRSAVYLIGKLKIAEGESLIEEMIDKEEDPCNKLLCALVLTELNRAKGINELKKLVKNGLNEETKKAALFTYYQHLINDDARKKD